MPAVRVQAEEEVTADEWSTWRWTQSFPRTLKHAPAQHALTSRRFRAAERRRLPCKQILRIVSAHGSSIPQATCLRRVPRAGEHRLRAGGLAGLLLGLFGDGFAVAVVGAGRMGDEADDFGVAGEPAGG